MRDSSSPAARALRSTPLKFSGISPMIVITLVGRSIMESLSIDVNTPLSDVESSSALRLPLFESARIIDLFSIPGSFV